MAHNPKIWMVGTELVKPFSLVRDCTLVVESENDLNMFHEVFVRGEHLADDIPSQPVRITWSDNTPYHPQKLSDSLLLIVHVSILLQPDWEWDSEIEKAWNVGEGDLLPLI